ncbi:MAG TPA: cytochrome c3 family protein [Myxococcales bacterium]
MIALLLWLAAGVPARPLAAARPATPARSATAHASGTKCEACHTAAGWRPVTFDHSKSGFPLEGRHLSASCRACHTSDDYRAPVPRTCAACHKDAHTGELGSRCASCHDARDWTSRFGPDAHRQTNFPLTGRHAAIPCEECHLDQRDRTFTRSTLDCVACHQRDFARTAGTALDHSRAGFGTDCKSCHFPSRFKGARFAGHERCFQISGGPHAGISCFDCHTSLASAVASGQCATGTADCMRCHACARVTPQHSDVAGFQCKDLKCYACHQFTPSGGALRAPPRMRGTR